VRCDAGCARKPWRCDARMASYDDRAFSRSKRRPARLPFRSMDWLRRAGLAYRLRALILLVSFAIGSLLARDAILIQQTMLLRAS